MWCVSSGQFIFERDYCLGRARFTLPATPAEQLPVDSLRLVPLGGDHVHTAIIRDTPGKFYVCASTGHVRRDGDATLAACVGDYLCLLLMSHRVKHLVFEPALAEHFAESFACAHASSTNQHRPAFAVNPGDFRNDSMPLAVFGGEHHVAQLISHHGAICWYHHHRQAVYLPELAACFPRGARHARQVAI